MAGLGFGSGVQVLGSRVQGSGSRVNDFNLTVRVLISTA